jgi:hypothetical protein
MQLSRRSVSQALALGMIRALVVFMAVTTAIAQGTAVDRLPMNQVQVLGSHNSYKQAIDPALLTWLRRDDPRKYSSLEYAHATLARQLDLGLRKLEIDVVYDPKGGLYAQPLGLRWLRDAGHAVPAYDPNGVMSKPGFKVLHIPDIDFRSHVFTLKDALRELRAWSDAHPRHLPIPIMMNAKDVGIDAPGAVTPLKFDAAAFDAWDAEIRSALPPEKLITPDDVRGRYATLDAAVQAHAWPTIGAARGKFLFVLDEVGVKQQTYITGHPALRGRVMFVNAVEGQPEAAFRVVNDPVASFQYIQKLVRAGYLVRTRADADTVEARQNDGARMEAAFASGAQFVSTDYYLPDAVFGKGFRVGLPGGGVSRWNPVIPPPWASAPPPE